MLDIFGFELRVGDTVAFLDSLHQEMTTGTIIHIYPKKPDMVHIKYHGGYTDKYPHGVVKRVLEPADLKLLKFTIGSNQ